MNRANRDKLRRLCLQRALFDLIAKRGSATMHEAALDLEPTLGYPSHNIQRRATTLAVKHGRLSVRAFEHAELPGLGIREVRRYEAPQSRRMAAARSNVSRLIRELLDAQQETAVTA